MTFVYDSAVIGLGPTGASCVRHLLASKEQLLATDSRQSPPCLDVVCELNQSRLTIHVGGFNAEAISQAKRLVFSPGVDRRLEPFRLPEILKIPATGDIQLFSDALAKHEKPGTFVAVTGSNGKSTIVDLCSQLLGTKMQVAVGGNFGTPALDLLTQTEVDCWILEASSFQLSLTCSLKADIAVLADISVDHLDKHDSFEDYVACKKRVFKSAELCIWNRSQPITRPAEDNQGQSISVGLQAPERKEDFGLITEAGSQYLVQGQHWRFPVEQLGICGQHNSINALCALAIAQSAGVSLDDCAQVLRSYKGLPHRLQKLGTADGITFVDDSKSTNEGSACAALQTLKQPGERNLLLLAGGLSKQSSFNDLAQAAKDCVRHAVFFGTAADKLQSELTAHLDCTYARNLEEAFAMLMAKAQNGDTLVLSPACSSQDQFEDFHARGLFFQALVKAWLGQCAQGTTA